MFKIVMFIEATYLVLTFFEQTEQEARALANGGILAGYDVYIFDVNGDIVI